MHVLFILTSLFVLGTTNDNRKQALDSIQHTSLNMTSCKMATKQIWFENVRYFTYICKICVLLNHFGSFYYNSLCIYTYTFVCRHAILYVIIYQHRSLKYFDYPFSYYFWIHQKYYKLRHNGPINHKTIRNSNFPILQRSVHFKQLINTK